MEMTFVPEVAAAIFLLVLTVCLQCAGVAARMEWLRSVTARGTRGFRPIRSALLVVKSAIAINLLHGLVILLWACFYIPGRWRLLGPLESMAGVLMCGVSVGLLFAAITRLVDRDPRHSQRQACANDPLVSDGESSHWSEQSYA